MATFRQSVVPAQALTTSSAALSGSNGAVTFLNKPLEGQTASLSSSAQFKFPLPRSSTTGVGSQVTSINVSYSVPNAAITSMTFAFAAVSFAPAVTSTAIPCTPSGFTLTTGNYNGVLTVSAPAYENGANPEYYLLTATCAVDTSVTTVLQINNIELVYLSNASASGAFTNLNVTGWANFGDAGTPTNVAAGAVSFVAANGTESANAVTANGVTGVITTSSLTTAGGATYLITLTDNKIAGTGTKVLCQIASYAGTFGTNGIPVIATAVATAANTAQIRIGNAHASNALAGIVTISYLVIN